MSWKKRLCIYMQDSIKKELKSRLKERRCDE